MKRESRKPGGKRGTQRRALEQETRSCPVCGTKFFATADREFCPVCILRRAFGAEPAATGAPGPEYGSAESAKEADGGSQVRRFEHYEVMLDTDGRPIELGRGAMGITYKAFDVDLHCPVTLKVIGERYLGDESARLRFLREARAAARLRHANVASVFHLGRTGSSYFYAMEFVEGETLENLIKRSGRLEINLAVEIVTQVAAGLAAVHEQHLVHRDIKTTNIMVRLKEGGRVTVKIIDLGLAKTLDQSASEAGISSPGAFAGTPEFASPEQFGGLGVDIRSDLYSLGVTLWVMVTGQTPFRGTSAEVMYQHQHAPLPLERLREIPQPVLVLLEKLLEKDPAQRFQTPDELLRAVPTIADALEARTRITRQTLQKTPSGASGIGTRKPAPRSGPKKISIARLPVTASDVFGREEDIAFLEDAWANQQVNVVTIVAWGGVGKSTLVNHWLRRMAAEHYRSAQLVFGWSFYRQGTSGNTSSADEFLDAALHWFGDPDPRLGTAWEKGERLAKLVGHRRTLLVLDGLEPLQNPPGDQEGRLREPSLQALLRELAAFNMGLCVITTRTPVTDLSDHQGRSALPRHLEHLSSDAGAQLLRALGVKGDEAELRTASDEFSGHCLALTLLGSYLTDAYEGDVRSRKEVSGHLAHDLRQGAHARKVMKSYQSWFGEGPELSVLRILGLFDCPAEEKAIAALLRPPAIAGLTESLTNLSPTEWRTVLARLRRARLLAGEDLHNPGYLDTHPLVREYYGEQLRGQRSDAWQECNKRLFTYYRALAPQLPESFAQMEPLFRAVTCGCNAGLFRKALHEIYIPRIQRGDLSFAADVLGVRGALLFALTHFFEEGRWGSPVRKAAVGQNLDAEDQLFVLMQTAKYLTPTRGLGAPETRICYEHAESLAHSLHSSIPLCVALVGQWRYSLHTEKMSTAMEIAQRVHLLAQKENDAALMIEAYAALAVTLYHSGNFEAARKYATEGVKIWRTGTIRPHTENPFKPLVVCMCYLAASEWHLGQVTSYKATMAEAIAVAKELKDKNDLAIALAWASGMAMNEGNPAAVARLASDLIELSTRDNWSFWLAVGMIHRGWTQSVSGDTADGILSIERGLRGYRGTGALLNVPYFLWIKAQALFLAKRSSEALEAIKEAEKIVARSEERHWFADLQRLHGVFLAALGGEDTEIETLLSEAVQTAKEQKSVSLEKRAKATYAEYRRQKASALGKRGFRLPLW